MTTAMLLVRLGRFGSDNAGATATGCAFSVGEAYTSGQQLTQCDVVRSMPRPSAITISGNAEAIDGGCTQVIGDTITITGDLVLQTTCDETGTVEITTNEMVGLVE